jgi:hypothetical protein
MRKFGGEVNNNIPFNLELKPLKKSSRKTNNEEVNNSS